MEFERDTFTKLNIEQYILNYHNNDKKLIEKSKTINCFEMLDILFKDEKNLIGCRNQFYGINNQLNNMIDTLEKNQIIKIETLKGQLKIEIFKKLNASEIEPDELDNAINTFKETKEIYNFRKQENNIGFRKFRRILKKVLNCC